MNQTQFIAAIEKIVTALKTAGYDPYAQLTGYVETGELRIRIVSGSLCAAHRLCGNRSGILHHSARRCQRDGSKAGC